MPSLVIRPDGPQQIRQRCGVTLNKDLAEHLGIHPAQVSRVLSGKHPPGNRFIAGVVDLCGLEFAFEHVFQIIPDDSNWADPRQRSE